MSVREDFLNLTSEVIVSKNDVANPIWRSLTAGKIRKIGTRLYTTNVNDTPEAIVLRNIWNIAAAFFPGAIIADRTAIELRPATDGSVFLISSRGTDIELPGAKLRPRRGSGIVEGDFPFREGLTCSSQARAFLENMRPSRARSGVSRTLSNEEIEKELERRYMSNGAPSLNILRDQIRQIAPLLGLEKEAAAFSDICGALLGTKDSGLKSAQAKALRAGEPYDSTRIARFDILHDALRAQAANVSSVNPATGDAAINQAFFEAYFSNFIEGTEFEVGEARGIIFDGVIPANRPDDAHDIQGTFDIVANMDEMNRVPGDFDDFVRLLRERHRSIMKARPALMPGEFKTRPNKAGSTTFVSPDYVMGTLRNGFDVYRRLPSGFDRAVFIMFMVTEIHPFQDGNGRLARIMMNAELNVAGESRILIPIVYRSNYLEGLKALSLNDNPHTLMRSLNFAQRYTANIPWQEMDQAIHVLKATHAFLRPEEGDAKGIRLRLPLAADMPLVPADRKP
jgi:hypothetical protein